MLSQWKIATILIAVLTVPVLAYSDTIVVPDDHPTIQGAIDASVNGDTVLVKPGTYVENIDFLGKAITVTSEQGAGVTAIDGNKNGSVAAFQSGEEMNSVLDGFTLTNGSGHYLEYTPGYWDYCGGGLLCHNSSPTISNNTLSMNMADNGGGIYCTTSASPIITNNTISQNRTKMGGGEKGGGIACFNFSCPTISNNTIMNNISGLGGGIYCKGSSDLTISDNNILENTAIQGGGIYGCESTLTITNNTISKNAANSRGGRGGGIFCYIDCDAIITNNIITLNKSERGGGIQNYHCSAVVTNNIISGNISTYLGGGIYCSKSYSTIANNIISGNSAINSGGGIYSNGAWPTIENCTFNKNIAYYGGGICIVHSSTVTVTNTILWNDIATIGSEIWIGSSIPYTAKLTISHTDVEGGKFYVYVEGNATLNWNAGMIDLDPQFADLVNDDLHLTIGSPCRDTGNIESVNELFDFEGDPRICLGTVDMGADEFYTHLYVTGDTTPGGSIEGKFIGLPATTPVGLFVGSGILPAPANTMWGEYWLQAPWFLFGPLGAIPSDGVMALPTTLPGSIPAPYDVPMQALIGLNADSLSNLCVLEVR